MLPSSETDDSRPILFRKHVGLPNLHCILGAKIDLMTRQGIHPRRRPRIEASAVRVF